MRNSENQDDVQLITFGRRDPNNSLDRNRNRHEMSNGGGGGAWKATPIYTNGHVGDTNGYVGSKSSDPEREQFLPAPVKLDPGWDAMALKTEDGSLQQHIQHMEENPPKDRLYIVYFIMMIHGIAILIPWNMFINAKSYFQDYKLDQGNQSSEALIDYRTNFMSYIGMASQYPNFIVNLINIFVQCGGNTLGIRILTGIIIAVVMFVVTAVLAMIDTSAWPETFFWVTMATAVIINSAVGIYQNSMFGISASLPMKYTNAIILGNNVSGTLVAVTNIIMYFVAPDQRTSAIYYFVVAVIILLLAFDAYFLISHTKFYRHYTELAELKNQEARETRKGGDEIPAYKLLFASFGRIFKEVYHLMFGVWFLFFITLALFPTVMSDIKPLSMDMNGDLFTGIFCFLWFNLFATLGNLTTEFIKWPGPRWINIVIVMRVAFIPLFILANFRADQRSLPVYITEDWVFIISGVLMSFSSGYLSSLCMMYAPKLVAPSDAPVAGMVMAFFLVLGILSGVNFSRIWSVII